MSEYVLLEDGVGVMLCEDGVTPVLLEGAGVPFEWDLQPVGGSGFWARVDLE